MKEKVTIERSVCDFCQREGILATCLSCQKEYCLTDSVIGMGYMVKPTLCRKCGDEDKDIVAICREFARLISKITQKRDARIVQLAKTRRLSALETPCKA